MGASVFSVKPDPKLRKPIQFANEGVRRMQVMSVSHDTSAEAVIPRAGSPGDVVAVVPLPLDAILPSLLLARFAMREHVLSLCAAARTRSF